MNYPEHLLPKINYKIIEWHNDLSHCYLIRHTPTRKIYTEDSKKISFELIKIQSDHLGDFSTNLLGVFEPNDNLIRVKGENSDYFNSLWIEGNNVGEPLYNKNFDIDTERGNFFLKISDLDGKIANYTNDKSDNIIAKCKILHTPTNCNFWHFSLRWYSIPEEKDVRELNISKKQRSKLLSSAKALIAEIAFGDEPVYFTLPPKNYLK